MLDALFRPTQPSAQGDSTAAKAEAGRILATGVSGDISQADHDYLVAVVSARTGLANADASKRIDEVIALEKQAVVQAKQTADAARKATSMFSFYTFASMLIGAFIACVAGAIGGRQRDAY
jgi:deoxycytidylate deaminase